MKILILPLFALTLCGFSASATAQHKIGLVLPLSGPLANTGNEIAAGTRAYIEEINAAGGIKGQKVELFIEDDKFDPKQTEELGTKLVKEKNIDAFLSCFGTVNCLALAKVAAANGVPLIAPIAGAQALHSPPNNAPVFALRASAEQEVNKLLDYLTPIGIRTAAVLVQDDGFGRGYIASTESLAAKQGVVLSKVTFVPTNADYAAAAAALLKSEPAAIILLANTLHSSNILKQLEAQNYRGMVLNLAGQANQGFVNSMVGLKQLTIFVTMTPSPFASVTPAASDYRRQWQAINKNDKFSYLSFEAYLNARLLTEALRKGERGAKGLINTLREGQFDLGGVSVQTGNKRKASNAFTDLAVLSKDGKFKH